MKNLIKPFVLQLLSLWFFSSIAIAAVEPPQAWKPNAEFSLEGGTLNETIHWISGWSYALNELGKQSKKAGDTVKICLSPHEFVEARILFTILNEKFRGMRITAEQASSALWEGATKYYGCK